MRERTALLRSTFASSQLTVRKRRFRRGQAIRGLEPLGLSATWRDSAPWAGNLPTMLLVPQSGDGVPQQVRGGPGQLQETWGSGFMGHPSMSQCADTGYFSGGGSGPSPLENDATGEAAEGLSSPKGTGAERKPRFEGAYAEDQAATAIQSRFRGNRERRRNGGHARAEPAARSKNKMQPDVTGERKSGYEREKAAHRVKESDSAKTQGSSNNRLATRSRFEGPNAEDEAATAIQSRFRGKRQRCRGAGKGEPEMGRQIAGGKTGTKVVQEVSPVPCTAAEQEVNVARNPLPAKALSMVDPGRSWNQLSIYRPRLKEVIYQMSF